MINIMIKYPIIADAADTSIIHLKSIQFLIALAGTSLNDGTVQFLPTQIVRRYLTLFQCTLMKRNFPCLFIVCVSIFNVL